MDIDLAALPDDAATLHRMIGDLTAALDSQQTEAQAKIDRLWQMIKTLQRTRFGRQSERLSPDQLDLVLEDLDTDIARIAISEPAEDNPGRSKQTGDLSRLPDHLERKDLVLDIDTAGCPGCVGALHRGGETVSEMLDFVPAHLQLLRLRRPKYGCRACGTIHQSPAADRTVAKGRPTPGFLAHILVSRYADHLPLYRQSRIFAHQGISLSRSTLANRVGSASRWLEALRDRLATPVFASANVFADDTPIPVLDPGRGRTRTVRLWVYIRDERPWADPDPPAAVYFYSRDRKAERPAGHLAQFRGTLQVDGYAGFEQLTARGTIQWAACWAHARRTFYGVHQTTGSPIAGEALRRIAALYAIESGIRGQCPDERRRVRKHRTQSLTDALKPGLEDQLQQVPPRGSVAEANRYTLARWPALCRFLEDGRIEIDDSAVERAIRPVALGRKKHLFAGSDGGADRWAVVASLLETTKLNGIEPYACIKDVIQRMTDGHPQSRIDELLPWNWSPFDSAQSAGVQ